MAGQLPGTKTENGGQTAQGRLSASEFNDMVQYIDDIPIANVVNAQEGKHITIEGNAVGNSQYPIAHANQAGYASQAGIAGAVGTAQSNLTKAQIESAIDAKVPKTTTVNGHALSSNVTVTKGDVGLGNVDNTSDANKPISTATQTALNSKQDTLVSGTNIKTINNQSLLGSGNIVIQGGGGEVNVIEVVKRNGTALPISNKAVDVSVPTKTSDLTNDSGFLTQHQDISGKLDAPSGGSVGNILSKTANGTEWKSLTEYESISIKYDADNGVLYVPVNEDDFSVNDDSEIVLNLSPTNFKRDGLQRVALNIKTINSQSLIGSGNLVVGGSGSDMLIKVIDDHLRLYTKTELSNSDVIQIARKGRYCTYKKVVIGEQETFTRYKAKGWRIDKGASEEEAPVLSYQQIPRRQGFENYEYYEYDIKLNSEYITALSLFNRYAVIEYNDDNYPYYHLRNGKRGKDVYPNLPMFTPWSSFKKIVMVHFALVVNGEYLPFDLRIDNYTLKYETGTTNLVYNSSDFAQMAIV